MGVEFIHRVLRVSALLAGLGFLFTSTALGVPFGLGFLAGAAWSTANLWLLTRLVTTAFSAERSTKKVLLLFLLKFPLLYACGFWLVVHAKIHILGALVGFSLPLAVSILKSAGRSLQPDGDWAGGSASDPPGGRAGAARSPTSNLS
ncbi:MAG: hypothetical protein HYU36_19510 [Planctomycetes bacterium]|nr:hypothetical protein [Planctomycetota bacterium]